MVAAMRRNTSLLLGFLLLLPACGSRTTLKVGTDGSVPPVPDGGGFDAGFVAPSRRVARTVAGQPGPPGRLSGVWCRYCTDEKHQ